MSAIPHETLQAQEMAADPASSAFVSANAGAGKTYVLARRVIQLMLSGADPGEILCLTYTRAAAAEMKNRIFAQLRLWAGTHGNSLAGLIEAYCGIAPDAAMLRRARGLLADALETPGGLRVQTIHAFAEALLQRFPFEAGLMPGFTLADQQMQAAMRAEAQAAVTREAAVKAETAACLREVAVHADDTLTALLEAFMAAGDLWQAWTERQPDAAKRDSEMREALGCAAVAHPGWAEEFLGAAIPATEWMHIATRLAQAPKNGGKGKAELLAHAAIATGHEQAMLYASAFFSANGYAKNFITGLDDSERALHARLKAEQERLKTCHPNLPQELDGLAIYQKSRAVIAWASRIAGKYAGLKRARNTLDFDDLIRLAHRLLLRRDVRHWVSYRLDHDIAHILVDEAQDNSAMQWDMIEAVAEEFFSGHGTRRSGTRTVFAVGDAKQSVYSFQGAAPQRFRVARENFARKARAVDAGFREVDLLLSFRSSEEILQVVDAVFAPDAALLPGERAMHRALPGSLAGAVCMWLVPSPERPGKKQTWLDVSQNGITQREAMAGAIAEKVASWLAAGHMPSDPATPLRASDILILMRSRTQDMMESISAALLRRGIAVSGADRIRPAQHMAVRDLVAIARHCLLPGDDMQLATVLRGPMFGLDDDTLFRLCHGRKGRLVTAMREHGMEAELACLARWRTIARSMRPARFFMHLLECEGGRERLMARFGRQVNDVLDEFIAMALAHEKENLPLMHLFLASLDGPEHEVKRESQGSGADEVRIMTVHGAKGLEAPLCIIADAGHRKSSRPRFIPAHAGEAPPMVLAPAKTATPPMLAPIMEQREQEAEAEEMRLLYVAMTRAKRELHMFSPIDGKGKIAGRWYSIVAGASAMQGRWQEPADGPALFFGHAPAVHTAALPRHQAQPAALLPVWVTSPASQAPVPPPVLSPSGAFAPTGPAAMVPEADPELHPGGQPMHAGVEDMREFGIMVHGLLERLPPGSAAAMAAIQRLEEAGDTPLAPVLAVKQLLVTLALAPWFSGAARAEVPVMADCRIGGKEVRISGRIDRVLVMDDRIMLADFKTGQAGQADTVAEEYRMQLALYARALAGIFPGRAICAGIIQVEKCRFLAVDTDRVYSPVAVREVLI